LQDHEQALRLGGDVLIGPVGDEVDAGEEAHRVGDPVSGPFGFACAGPLGELPAIGTAGGEAFPGNDDFDFTVSTAPAFSLAVLLISDQFTTTPLPGAPGCNLYAGLPFLTLLATVTDGAGFGSVDLPIPCGIPNGAALAFQWGVYTPGHNAFGWIVSNDLDISWSHN
jgi:hypothetical protein